MDKSHGLIMGEIVKWKSKFQKVEEPKETPFNKKNLHKMVFGSKVKIPPPKFCPASERRGLDRLTNEQTEPEMEDPEVVAARQEQEKRRKDKHRRMEADRERMRQAIRDKYHLKKKVEPREQDIAGRIAGNRKTPEQVAMESLHDEEDEGLMTALNDTYEKAKSTVVSACTSVANAVNLWKS